MTEGFALNHHLEDVSVQRALLGYTSHADWLLNSQEKLALYLPYLAQEVRQRQLPSELALLPIVESMLDPQARSPQGALGLWQFMPGTASRLGLHRDHWHDGRQDIVASTQAALDYLEELHGRFGDWLLAIAAYNAGEGKVSRLLGARKENNRDGRAFFRLRLPAETRRYVPRVLALAAIVKDPAAFAMRLPAISTQVAFDVVQAPGAVDLALAARALKVDANELMALNPALKHLATPPGDSHHLLVPTRVAATAEATLDAASASITIPSPGTYKVRKGDTLLGIAHRFRTTVPLLRSYNRLGSDRIVAGSTLTVPGRMTESPPVDDGHPASARVAAYRVRQGDTLSDLAARFGTSVNWLKTTNSLRSGRIRTGDVLDVPSPARPQQQASLRNGLTLAQVTATTAYRIRSGDTLSEIAGRHRISVADLKTLNGIQGETIRAGRTLRVPAGTVAASTTGAVAGIPPAQVDRYTVRSGDTLWSIARRHAVSRQELMRVNNLRGNHVLRAGTTLQIPAPASALDVAGG
ncbi:MAG: LysM peptidoglycan-binding domain-containing protein [Pseudomonadales bacterium]|nr:LysM peptidoglycan-binding domain-containing protein [Pseudomonadales bacterium]